jgi:RNA polymerase sigma factor (TIGR02999 family)
VSDVTLILQKIENGDPRAAAEELLPLVYQELRKLAASKMRREASAYTLQPTALVHEAGLRLGGDGQPAWQNRAHFFAAAAEAMRRILIDRARRRRAIRHGGGQELVNADEVELSNEVVRADDQLLALHDALEKFSVEEPRKAELVKLRYFAGLTLLEAADAMGIPEGTAKRWWTYSRARLYRELRPNDAATANPTPPATA